MTWTLVIIYFLGGLKYGQVEMSGWESPAVCESAAHRVSVTIPDEVRAGTSLSISLDCVPE
jgi:hypothetical protein